MIASLLAEGYLKREIATWLGHRRGQLHWRRVNGHPAGVTIRTTLRLRLIQRRQCGRDLNG